MCFKYGQNGHTSIKFNKNTKYFRCSDTDHKCIGCPVKIEREQFKCPNGPHPATYVGCQ